MTEVAVDGNRVIVSTRGAARAILTMGVEYARSKDDGGAPIKFLEYVGRNSLGAHRFKVEKAGKVHEFGLPALLWGYQIPKMGRTPKVPEVSGPLYPVSAVISPHALQALEDNIREMIAEASASVLAQINGKLYTLLQRVDQLSKKA